MTATERFLACSRDLWDAYLDHPFVRGIADGSLDEEKFRYYMVQDYLYLVEYARVFALGVAKARDMESMRLFAGYVGQILDGEMDIHRGYMKRLGIKLEDAEHAALALDNRSYTSYMLNIAYTDGPAAIMAARRHALIFLDFMCFSVVCLSASDTCPAPATGEGILQICRKCLPLSRRSSGAGQTNPCVAPTFGT